MFKNLLSILLILLLSTFCIFPVQAEEEEDWVKNWDGHMMVHPSYQKEYGKCLIGIKAYRIINPDYKKTGGAYVTIVFEKYKIGHIEVDHMKGTLNGEYHECLDKKEEIEKLKEYVKNRKEDEYTKIIRYDSLTGEKTITYRKK